MSLIDIYQREQQNLNQIVFYESGNFYRAYERSAFFFCNIIDNYNVVAQRLNGTSNGNIVFIGFPKSSAENHIPNFNSIKKEGNKVVLESKLDFNLENFSEWRRKSVELYEERKRIAKANKKIARSQEDSGTKSSTVVKEELVRGVPVGKEQCYAQIIDEIKAFNIALSSPFDCQNLLLKFQQMIFKFNRM